MGSDFMKMPIEDLAEDEQAQHEHSPIETHAKGVRPIRFIRASEIELTPVEWLIKGYIEKNAIVFIYGETEAFKTFIALSMACAVAGGLPWGPDCIVKQGPVLYVCGEGERGIRRRLEAWSRHHDEDIPADLLISTTSIDFGDTVQIAGLVSEIKAMKQPPLLVSVDTFARNYGGAENDNDDIGRFYQIIETELVKPFGCTVIVNHHPGKDASKGARGGASIKQNADALYKVQRQDHGEQWFTVLSNEKMKDAEKPREVMFEAVKHDLGIVDDDGKPVTSLALDYVDNFQRKVLDANTMKERSHEAKEKRRSLLRAIHEDPTALQIDYAARLEVDQSTVSRDMKWLRNKQYLTGKTGSLQVTRSGRRFGQVFNA